MSRIRVLQVVWRLARGGGKPIVVRGLLHGIDREVFEVHVCTVRPLFDEDRVGELGDGITYHPLNLLGRTSIRLRASAIAGVAGVVRRVRPQVLHVHGGVAWYSIPAALFRPSMARLIEIQDAPQSGRLSAVNYAVERFMARRLSFRPIVHSQAVRDGLVEAWRIPPERILRFGLGIDTDRFAKVQDDRLTGRAALDVAPEVPLVTYVARLVPEKRPELFLEVARRVTTQHPDAVFALVGSGAALESSRLLADRMGLDGKVRIPGFVEDLPAIYRASDVFLSTSAYEGFGLAVAEAMASGLPVVSTHVGAVGEVVGDAGILEDSGDPDKLALHVLALLGDADRRGELGRRARKRATEYLDVRKTVKAFEEAYRQVAP